MSIGSHVIDCNLGRFGRPREGRAVKHPSKDDLRAELARATANTPRRPTEGSVLLLDPPAHDPSNPQSGR